MAEWQPEYHILSKAERGRGAKAQRKKGQIPLIPKLLLGNALVARLCLALRGLHPF
jgi:hypothetical protein